MHCVSSLLAAHTKISHLYSKFPLNQSINPLNKTCSWGYSRIFAMSCNDPEYPTSHKVYS